jgi:hypothetical protein
MGDRTVIPFALVVARRPGLLASNKGVSVVNPDTWTVLEDLEGNVFCVTGSTTLSGWTQAGVSEQTNRCTSR